MSLGEFVFAGGTAVVTGAASGIGEQLAHGLARRGTDLVLLDRDADRLSGVVQSLRAAHPARSVDEVVVDLADRTALDRAAAGVLAKHPRLTLLVNNAGVALAGRFDQVSMDQFDWLVEVNFRAPVALTHHLLPLLRRSPGSHLVVVSSVFGLVGQPGQTAYAASKFALRGFAESLRPELARDLVGVTAVHPGGVRTRIAQDARAGHGVDAEEAAAGKLAFDRYLTYPADRAAEKILAGVQHRRDRVLVGATAVVPDLLQRLLPTHHLPVLARLHR